MATAAVAAYARAAVGASPVRHQAIDFAVVHAVAANEASEAAVRVVAGSRSGALAAGEVVTWGSLVEGREGEIPACDESTATGALMGVVNFGVSKEGSVADRCLFSVSLHSL